MAPTLNFDREQNQVLFTGNSCVKVVILNRPQKLNTLNHEMICQIKRNLELYENDPLVKLVILKGNGKAFCAGGDVVSVMTSAVAGHWTYAARFYKKHLTLDYLVGTYKKPIVSLINGVVMGGGAGLSMTTRFRVVTEKAVFAMPEASMGLSPDVGSNYFLSRLPGYFGEYLGLTGARLGGAEMAACGLATHFVPSLKLKSLENALQVLNSPIVSSTITALIETFAENPNVKEDSPFRRLDVINKCFSKGTVEEIIESLEHELENGAEKWITDSLSYMRSSCPISLKIFLKSIRRGRVQRFDQCLYRDYNIVCHLFRGTFGNDLYEGSRAKLFDKDNKPKWEPSKLELVDEEMVDQYLRNVNEEWEFLRFPDRSNSQIPQGFSVIYIVVILCIGTIYLNVGTGYNSILARGSCASFVFGFVTFMSIGGFPSFVEDMKVFQRERLNGHYGVTAFVISNTLSAMPFLILITFLSGTICYFMVRLHPGFWHYLFFVLCLYASVTVVESLMMAIASIVPNFLMGIIIGAGIQGIFMLVSGYFRLPHDIPKPVWRYPMSYISFHFWALQGQYQNDLRGLLFDNQTPDLPKIPGEYILEKVFQIDVNRSKWINLSVIFSMIVIYRIIFFIMIKINEDVTPWVRGYLARRRMQQKSGAQNTTIAPDVLTQSPSLRTYVSPPTK